MRLLERSSSSLVTPLSMISARTESMPSSRIAMHDGAWRVLDGLLRPHARSDLGDAGDLAVDCLRKRADPISRDIARDDQNSIVGRVETPIKRERVFTVELLDFMAPADDRPTIGVVEIKRGLHLLTKPRA